MPWSRTDLLCFTWRRGVIWSPGYNSPGGRHLGNHTYHNVCGWRDVQHATSIYKLYNIYNSNILVGHRRKEKYVFSAVEDISVISSVDRGLRWV